MDRINIPSLFGFLVVCLAGVPPITSPAFGQPPIAAPAKPWGIAIRQTRPGWPAQQTGLEAGDIITKIDGIGIWKEEFFHRVVRDASLQKRELVLTVIDARTSRELNRRIRPSRVDGKLGVF
jgi:S1-C subfamily serine protease